MSVDLEDNLKTLKDKLAKTSSKLVAVSKRKPNEDIQKAYDLGQRDFGENQVQELTGKVDLLPPNIRWHMIGHLQRNKVKDLVGIVHLIHSVDSPRLLREINKRFKNAGQLARCLLQVHIADEEHKFGFDFDQVRELVTSTEVAQMEHVEILGLMGMATNTEDEDKIRSEFRRLKSLFEELKEKDMSSNVQMQELSMGMTSDYTIAIEEGSTMVRIGSAIFGPRDY